MLKREVKKHGTTTGYTYGCRCDLCRAAIADYQRKRAYENTTKGYLEKLAAEDRARKARMAEIAAHRADWDALFADALKTAEAAKPAVIEDRIETGFEDLV